MSSSDDQSDEPIVEDDPTPDPPPVATEAPVAERGR